MTKLGFLGGEVSNLALQFLPGAIYVVGALTEELEGFFDASPFPARLRDLGSPILDAILERTPVFLSDVKDGF